VFTRYPEPGRTKKRLIPALGQHGAARLQYRMTRNVLDMARSLGPEVETTVWFRGGDAQRMAALFGPDLRYREQRGAGLGERMYRALKQGVQDAHSSVVLVGSDCPGISQDILHSAFEQLAEQDLVLGPAADGGYYLIGIRPDFSLSKLKRLMQGMQWGTGEVLGSTRKMADCMGLRTGTVSTLRDMDEPGDLRHLPSMLNRSNAPILSLVIPALNEGNLLGRTLESLRDAENVETVLADGGSSDASRSIAQSHGARIACSAPGRARQMNAGAAASSGLYLLFLHADTTLPFLFESFVRTALAEPGVSGGSFRFALRGAVAGGQLIEAMVNVRSLVIGLPFGDQGIFCSRRAFDSIGGYPDVPILEDVHLVRRLKGQGRLVQIPEPAATSSRRWRELGVVRTTLVNQAILAGYALGVPERALARMYRRRRGAKTPDEA
jgi:hypothetical protein